MPYIAGKKRRRHLARVGAGDANNGGELNFILYRECLRYLRHNGVSYQSLADVHSSLTLADDEIKRRITWPYEDKKIIENGDV